MSRMYYQARCRCGFERSGKGHSLTLCPTCKRDLRVTVHHIPDFLRVGRRVDYHSIIGGPVTIPGAHVRSDVFFLGETPCVNISGKSGGVNVAALTEAKA